MNSAAQKTNKALLRVVIDQTREAEENARKQISSLGVGSTTADLALKRCEYLENAVLQLVVALRNTVRVLNEVVDDL